MSSSWEERTLFPRLYELWQLLKYFHEFQLRRANIGTFKWALAIDNKWFKNLHEFQLRRANIVFTFLWALAVDNNKSLKNLHEFQMRRVNIGFTFIWALAVSKINGWKTFMSSSWGFVPRLYELRQLIINCWKTFMSSSWGLVAWRRHIQSVRFPACQSYFPPLKNTLMKIWWISKSTPQWNAISSFPF